MQKQAGPLSDIQDEGYTSVQGESGYRPERAADCAYYIKNGAGAQDRVAPIKGSEDL
jgi:hypothetical protein